jgi:hypothetical protein
MASTTTELVKRNTFTTRDEARVAIFSYIVGSSIASADTYHSATVLRSNTRRCSRRIASRVFWSNRKQSRVRGELQGEDRDAVWSERVATMRRGGVRGSSKKEPQAFSVHIAVVRTLPFSKIIRTSE